MPTPEMWASFLTPLSSSSMTSYFWPWSIDHTCSTSLRVRFAAVTNNSKILVVENFRKSTGALPDSAKLILKMQVKFRSMACISSFQTKVMEHHHNHQSGACHPHGKWQEHKRLTDTYESSSQTLLCHQSMSCGQDKKQWSMEVHSFHGRGESEYLLNNDIVSHGLQNIS